MPTSKRTANQRTRHEAILDAARKLFAEKGVESTSMDDIARLAGCTRRTLYAYFKNWDDLCLQILLDSIATRWELQCSAMDASETGVQKLRAWGCAYWAYAQKHPEELRLQFFRDYHRIDLSVVPPEVEERFGTIVDPIVATMRTVFQLGQQDGGIHPDRQADTCIAQYAYGLRAVMHRVLSPGDSFADFDPDTFVTHFIELFLSGLAADPEICP